MQNEFFAQWSEFTNQAIANAKALEQINTKAVSQIAEKQVALLTDWMDTSVRQMELVTKAKDYSDIVKGQTQIAREWNEKIQDAVKDTSAIVSDCREELTAWFENRVAQNADLARKTASRKAA